MVMNFDNIPLQRIPHFKGDEGEVLARMHTDEMGKIVHLTLPAGASIGLHTHDTSAEVVYVIAGRGIVLEDEAPNGDPIVVEAGTVTYCPKGHSHSLINNSDADLVVLGVIPELG